MKVRAKRLGYIYNKRRREGDVFELKDIKGKKKLKDGVYEDIEISAEQQFSDKWMEKVDDREKLTHDDSDINELVLPKKKFKKKVEEVEASDTDDEVL